jgi:hypothetical protein
VSLLQLQQVPSAWHEERSRAEGRRRRAPTLGRTTGTAVAAGGIDVELPELPGRSDLVDDAAEVAYDGGLPGRVDVVNGSSERRRPVARNRR